ncbi:calcium-binding protein [Methylocystis heyeri]|nr:calcium-binding protein [Methylocystis heyeri]
MTLAKMFVIGLIGGGLSLSGAFFFPTPSFAQQAAIKALDADNDGTLDLGEVTKAAQIVFDRLEKDQDATLDRKEIGSRLNAKEFSAADPDKDTTLTKEEYVALAAKLFKQADVEGDGTLDARELRSKAGRALLRLIR